MNRFELGLLTIVVTGCFTHGSIAADPESTTQPVPATQATSATQRSKMKIMSEFTGASRKIADLMADPSRWQDPAFRAAHPDCPAQAKRVADLLGEYSAQLPAEKQSAMNQVRATYATVAAYTGDAASNAWLESLSRSEVKEDRDAGLASLILRDWWAASEDTAKRAAAIQRACALATTSPDAAATPGVLNAIALHADPGETKLLRAAANQLTSTAGRDLALKLERTAKKSSP